MRPTIAVATALALAAVVSPGALLGAGATAASALFEATPFLLAGALLARFFKADWAAFLGCGCGSGPSARSIPAAAATALVFGPAVAAARFAAAVAVARALRSRMPHACGSHETLLGGLRALLPSALLAGAAAQFAAFAHLTAANAAVQLATGAFLGVAAAPCGIGAVAVAGALHARAPFAAAAFLCTAGIVDARALLRVRHDGHAGHDVFAYALLAAALAVVALRHGSALVHPAIAAALGAATIAASALGWRYRSATSAAARTAPALMLLCALASAPPPSYAASETTMSGLFPGQRLDVTAALARDRDGDALVRYAILCCRADAAPVAIRLASRVRFPPGTWLRANGTVVEGAGRFALAAATITPVAPPSDPFIYR